MRGALISTLTAANSLGYLVAYTGNFVFRGSENSLDRPHENLCRMWTFIQKPILFLDHTVGSFSYNAMAEFSIALIAVSAGLLFYLPESPLYLVKQSKIAVNNCIRLRIACYINCGFYLQDAERSIRFYQNIGKSNENCDKIVQQEIAKLQTTIADDQNANNIDSSLKWSDFTTKVAQKALFLGVVLIGLYVWNGIYGMSAYIANIVEQAGSPLSPNVSVIVIGFIQVISVCIAIATVDWFGRKPLIAVSGIGVAMGFTIFGVHAMLKSWQINVENFSWIPLVR